MLKIRLDIELKKLDNKGEYVMHDKELKIIISDRKASYDVTDDKLSSSIVTVTRFRKNGYLTYDMDGNNIGLVFESDDNRTVRYGNAEIVFFKEYKEEYGTWRIIKIHGQYLPYTHLEDILQKDGRYLLTTDERYRKN